MCVEMRQFLYGSIFITLYMEAVQWWCRLQCRLNPPLGLKPKCDMALVDRVKSCYIIIIIKLYWINKYIYQKEGAQTGLEIPCEAHLQLNF